MPADTADISGDGDILLRPAAFRGRRSNRIEVKVKKAGRLILAVALPKRLRLDRQVPLDGRLRRPLYRRYFP